MKKPLFALLALVLLLTGCPTHPAPEVDASDFAPAASVDAAPHRLGSFNPTCSGSGLPIVASGVQASACLANGANGTVLTISGGVPAWVNPSIDPSSMGLAGWWRASYAGSPWTPSASTGPSGTNGNLTEATNPPATGTAVNSLTPATFNGTTSQLHTPSNADTYLSTAAGTIVVLFKATAAAADAGAGTPYGNPALVGLNGAGNMLFGFSTSGLRGAIYNGAAYVEAPAIACATGAWHMGMLRWNGSVLEQSLDAGTPTSIATVSPSSLAFPMRVGVNYNGSAFFTGSILEVLTLQSSLSNANVTNIKSAFNVRYGLSL